MGKVQSHHRTRSDTGTVSHVGEYTRRDTDKKKLDKKQRRASKGSLEKMIREESSPESESEEEPLRKEKLNKEELKKDRAFLSRVFGGAAVKATLAGAAAIFAAGAAATPLAVGLVAATVAAESSFSHVLHSRLAQRSTNRKPGQPEKGKKRRTFAQWAADELASNISDHTNAVSYAGIGALAGMAFSPVFAIVGGAAGFASSYVLSRNNKKIDEYKEEVSEGKPALRKKIEKHEQDSKEDRKEIKHLNRELAASKEREADLRIEATLKDERILFLESELAQRKANEELLQAELEFERGTRRNNREGSVRRSDTSATPVKP